MNRILNISAILSCLLCFSCEQAENPGNDGQTDTTPSVVRVGIMGDSISTFEGELVNDDYKFHYPCVEGTRNNPCGVSKVEQTWWWQLINEKMENGVLDVNNSFSGTKVSHGTYAGISGAKYEAGFVDRVEDFIDPDVIIIHGGTNDYLKDTDKENIGDYQWDTPLEQVDLTKFRSAYVYLVRKLQELYDGVQLILIVGDRIGANASLEYDDTIIEIAEHFDLPYVDLTPHFKVDIPVPDNCHPSDVGHAFIAQKIYDTCKDYLKAGRNPGNNDDKVEILPDEMTVNLDFTQGWPFVEPCVPADSQLSGGEKYTYRYGYQEGEETHTVDMEFAFNSGVKQTGTYSYDADTDDGNGRALCYKFGEGTDTGYGYIKFPVIKGKYLKSVALVHRTPIPAGATGNNLNGFYFTLQKGGFPSHATPAATSTRVKAGEELVIAFPMNGLVSDLGQYYCMRVRFKDIEFERITLVYSDKKPSHEMELPENSHLYAHRGRWSKDESGSFLIPENSLHGIREAALMGYEGVECDVKCLTKDGKMVMNHDYTLDRTMRKASDYSKVTGEIRLDALTFAEIRNNYVLESSVPEFRIAPPTFEEFLKECKEWNIRPMLHSSYEQAFRLAAEIMGDNWVCFSSDYEKVKAVREYSNCTILWSVDSGTPEEIIEKLEAIGGDCGISSMEYSLYTPEFVSAIRAAGYHVQCSVFSDGEEKKAIENGVDYILTDRIQPVGYDKNGSILDNPKDHIITPEPADTPDVPQPDVQLPEDFAVTLDFASWPFAEPCAEVSAQTATRTSGGEYYSYLYKYTKTDGTEGQCEMKFGIKRSHAASGDVAYSHADGCLSFGTAGDGATFGIINVPGVKDRYVSSIEITHDKTAYFTIADGSIFAYDATPNANTPNANTPNAAGPTLIEFPYEYGSKLLPAGLSLSYNIRMRTSGVGISKIVITYSVTEPK